MFLLVARFDSPPADGVLQLLAAQPPCRRLRFARSPDVAGVWVLVAEFDSARDYRAAIGPFDVRTTVLPWLQAALPDSGVHEVVLAAEAGVVTRHETTVRPADESGRVGH